MSSIQRIRGRQAQTPGATFLSYTPDGTKLITVGLDNYCRVFTTGSDAEPVNIDDCMDNNTAIAAANDFFVAGSEDGTVCKYSLHSNKLEEVLVRTSLPVRDVALSPDGSWVAVASDELVVKVVNTQDMTRVLYLREQPRAPKHVAFDNSGSYLAVSCTDGQIYVYSLSSEEPELMKKVDGMIKSLDSESEASSKVLWHPDGRAFATPAATREIQVMSRIDWEKQKTFRTTHSGDITAAAWSPNGALLATTAKDQKLCLWDAKTQKLVKTYDDIRATILAVAWHPTENILSYTNNDGELYIHTDIVPPEHASLVTKPLQPAPFLHDPLDEASGGARKIVNGTKTDIPVRRARQGTPDSLDDILGSDAMSDDGGDLQDFVVDDDGAGYADVVNGHGKRTNGHLGAPPSPHGKRRAYGSHFQPTIHESFQPGSTPWRGNRRYLCLNLTGFVWTVSQETHHTVTVEFYDREFHRDFHFTDPFLYDKACLNENGTLFSAQPAGTTPATIYYRPHETWTTRTDWRTQLPAGERVTSIALSDSYVVVTTSTNYVRIFTLFGVPVRVMRLKSSPTVTCAAWRDYVLTIGNGPVGGDGMCRLLYTIENVKRDEVYQSEDTVALTPNSTLQSVFFSDAGDPYIYDSDGVLLTLLHWRSTGQARWIPLLDTKLMDRLRDGGKEETYWPVAVAQSRFHCIILKGADKYPYFPRPILTEFAFQIPLSSVEEKGKKKRRSDDDDEETMDLDDQTANPDSEQNRLEQAFILTSTLHSQLQSTLSHTRPTHSQKQALVELEVQQDRTLLQLLGLECLAGEDHGMKALEIVGLMRDANGKMLELAGRVAGKYGREVLGEKIRELAERRLVGLDTGDED